MTTPPAHGLLAATPGHGNASGGMMRNAARPGLAMALVACLWGLALLPSASAGDKALAVESRETAAPLDAGVPVDDLPEQFLGVWYRDNPHDRSQCARYHAAPSLDVDQDEGSIAMIGSIVVTPGLVHEYAEYGEGSYNAVRRVARVAESVWRVDVEIGLDVMPGGGGYDMPGTYRLEMAPGGLIWTPWHAPDQPPTLYFRCGAVREDLYGPQD
ncbi:hypothetical protein [Luteimonas sp. SDU101]|uniref:hypothetical protein n=1 Tax=Luteimonas sp. SDU101 TaxID=3422593 RepID=UPI003EC06314